MRSICSQARLTAAITLLGVGLLAPRGAYAHGAPIMIDFYGPFSAGATKCLRRITLEGKRCARETYAAHRRCMDEEIQGRTCDRTQRDIDLDNTMGKALSAVERECTGGQITEVGLITYTDARSDMRQFCLRAQDIAEHTYYPAENMPGDPMRIRCALLAAELNEKVFLRTLHLKGQALDRIGVRFLTRTQKLKLLSHAAKRIGITRANAMAKFTAECPDFETIYNRSLGDYTTAVEQSGDCALSFLYVQNVVLCPQ